MTSPDSHLYRCEECGKMQGERKGRYCSAKCNVAAWYKINRGKWIKYAADFRAKNKENPEYRAQKKTHNRNAAKKRRENGKARIYEVKRYWKDPQKHHETVNRARKKKIKLRLLRDIEQIGTQIEIAMQTESLTFEEIKKRCQKLSLKKLQTIFAQGLRLIQENLIWTAHCLVELEARGQQVEGERALLSLLRQVAAGKLLADVAVRFVDEPRVRQMMATKSTAEQKELLSKSDQEIKGMLSPRAVRTPSIAEIVERCMGIIHLATNPQEAAEQLLNRLQGLLAEKGAA